MGMIRVSDEVEKKLKEVSDGRSMTATVDYLFRAATGEAERIFGDGNGELVAAFAGSVNDRLDKLASYLEKKFSHLEALIEDTAIDRLEKSGGDFQKHRIDIKWEDAKDFLWEEDGIVTEEEYLSSQFYTFLHEECSDELPIYTDGTTIYRDAYKPLPILKVTPKIREFLKSRGYNL